MRRLLCGFSMPVLALAQQSSWQAPARMHRKLNRFDFSVILLGLIPAIVIILALLSVTRRHHSRQSTNEDHGECCDCPHRFDLVGSDRCQCRKLETTPAGSLLK
jgi:hypothetical protein